MKDFALNLKSQYDNRIESLAYVECSPELLFEGRSELKVFIEYNLPSKGIHKLLAGLFGQWYANWCTNQMAQEASHYFARRL